MLPLTSILFLYSPAHAAVGRRSGDGDYFFGGIDEVRISTVPRSAAWIGAQHRSMADSLVRFE